MALALARKYRPRRFTDLLVQDHVAEVLRNAILSERVGHGYLLTGPRGVGKTTAARILAMALNCERKGATTPAGEPCGECQSCHRIWTGVANLDVVEIDAASNRGVDDARDLRERAMYAASREGGHKVYIVDEAHMLTREAWNALLKILEEPPPGVVFVFATTEPQKIAQTAAPVLSRLQRFDFRRIGAGAIRDRLRGVLDEERIEADDDALTLIARRADGGMRDALSILDQCLSFGDGRVTGGQVRQILGLVDDEAFEALLAAVTARDAAQIYRLLDRLEEGGADLVQFAGEAAEALRNLLKLRVGVEPEGLTEAMRQVLAGHLPNFAAPDLLRMLKLAGESEASLRRSATPRLAVETLLLRFAFLDRTVSLEEVLRQAPGSPKPPAAPPRPRPPAEGAAPKAKSSPPIASPPALDRATPTPTGEPVRAEFTLDGLVTAWPSLVAAARGRSRFLGEALGAARPVAVDPPEVKVAISDGSSMHAEALARQREALEGLIREAVGRPVRVVVLESSASSAPAAPRRLSDAEARAERLKVLRSRDPALETAAEVLDLEVLE